MEWAILCLLMFQQIYVMLSRFDLPKLSTADVVPVRNPGIVAAPAL